MSDSPILPAAGSEPSRAALCRAGESQAPDSPEYRVFLANVTGASLGGIPIATSDEVPNGVVWVGKTLAPTSKTSELRANAVFTGDRLSNQHFPWGRE